MFEVFCVRGLRADLQVVLCRRVRRLVRRPEELVGAVEGRLQGVGLAITALYTAGGSVRIRASNPAADDAGH